MERPVDPIPITLLNGEQRMLLLSQGGYRRVQRRLRESHNMSVVEYVQKEQDIGPLIWEALQDKGDLTEEEFYDLLPVQLADAHETVAKLLNLPSRPTVAAAEAAAET